jgi:hypothetical protein
MNGWRSAVAAATLCLLTAELLSAQEDEVTLLRVFHKRTALVATEFRAGRRSRDFLDADHFDAESAAAARQYSL